MPNILKCQKAFWFLFFSCALSPRKGMLGVCFLLFIGVLLRHTSCLFCMVFAKMPLAWGNLLPFFVCNFGPQEVSSLSLFPLFLIRYSVCCTFNQHTGLFLRCTIKKLFLCLTPLFALVVVSGGTCFLPADCRQEGGKGSFGLWSREGTVVGLRW